MQTTVTAQWSVNGGVNNHTLINNVVMVCLSAPKHGDQADTAACSDMTPAHQTGTLCKMAGDNLVTVHVS